MAAHITMGRIGEVYHKDLMDTIYQICRHRDEQWEMINTRKDGSVAAFIQELNQHIRRQENQICADMMELKKAKTRIIDLEEELKFTRNGYEEEIKTLLEKNDDLVKKIGVFMGGPAPIEEEEPKEIRPEDYIIIDDTDSDPSEDDFEDEAGADIMESSTGSNF